MLLVEKDQKKLFAVRQSATQTDVNISSPIQDTD